MGEDDPAHKNTAAGPSTADISWETGINNVLSQLGDAGAVARFHGRMNQEQKAGSASATGGADEMQEAILDIVAKMEVRLAKLEGGSGLDLEAGFKGKSNRNITGKKQQGLKERDSGGNGSSKSKTMPHDGRTRNGVYEFVFSLVLDPHFVNFQAKRVHQHAYMHTVIIAYCIFCTST